MIYSNYLKWVKMYDKTFEFQQLGKILKISIFSNTTYYIQMKFHTKI